MRESPSSFPPRHQRSDGMGEVDLHRRGGKTELQRLHQAGAAKIRLPRSHGRDAIDVVLINTSGGLAGGDKLDWRVTLGVNAQAVVTTQACERVYRALAEPARVSVRLQVGAGGRLDWLPQETMIYDGSGLERHVAATLAEDSTLLIVEPVLLGRLAHGERVRHGHLQDRWRVRRGDRLVFAEDTRLDGPVASIAAQAATLRGGAAYASILLIEAEAERRLDAVRARLPMTGDACCGGASAFDGKLICRLIAPDGVRLRQSLIPVLTVLRGGLGMPRLWTN